MYVIIVGAGDVGTALARWFVSTGHEIAVIERNRVTGQTLDEITGSVSVVGDATEEAVQAKAGTNRADAFIATTGHDEVNLAACQLARHRFGVRRTVSTVTKPDRSKLFELLGIDVAIDVPSLVATRIREVVDSDSLVHLLPVGVDGRSVVALRIPQGSSATGRSMSEIDLPSEALVSLVISRDGTSSIPTDQTRLQPGDEIVVSASAQAVEELKERLALRAGE